MLKDIFNHFFILEQTESKLAIHHLLG